MATSKKTDDKPEKKPEPKKPQADKIDPNPVDVREPYPTGAGRDPEEDFKAAHGYSRKEE